MARRQVLGAKKYRRTEDTLKQFGLRSQRAHNVLQENAQLRCASDDQLSEYLTTTFVRTNPNCAWAGYQRTISRDNSFENQEFLQGILEKTIDDPRLINDLWMSDEDRFLACSIRPTTTAELGEKIQEDNHAMPAEMLHGVPFQEY